MVCYKGGDKIRGLGLEDRRKSDDHLPNSLSSDIAGRFQGVPAETDGQDSLCDS